MGEGDKPMLSPACVSLVVGPRNPEDRSGRHSETPVFDFSQGDGGEGRGREGRVRPSLRLNDGPGTLSTQPCQVVVPTCRDEKGGDFPPSHL